MIRGFDRKDAISVPIFAVTANAYESDIQNCLDAGINAHLAKLVEPQKLYQTIEKQLENGTERHIQ